MFARNYKNLNRITVSRSALKNNYAYLQESAKNSLVAPVLKSNAYGHGLEMIGQFVSRSLKPPFICVDSLHEAYQLKSAGVSAPILIIGYTFPENFTKKKKLPFSIPLFDVETLKYLHDQKQSAKVHVKIDTGMNRLGLQINQIPSFIQIAKKTKRIEFEGIYSHFSQADEPKNKAFTARQISTFKEAIKIFKHYGFLFKWRHISATAGISAYSDPEFNLVRTGLGFYGYSPFAVSTKIGRAQRKELEPALTFESHLIQIKDIRKGAQVGYGGTYIAPKAATIGLLPVGYYDGIDRRLSNRGEVMIDGTMCPILGRVSMNVTVVDLSNIKNPYVGQEVVVISSEAKRNNSLDKLSRLANTIPFDLLVHLAESTKRVMVE